MKDYWTTPSETFSSQPGGGDCHAPPVELAALFRLALLRQMGLPEDRIVIRAPMAPGRQ